MEFLLERIIHFELNRYVQIEVNNLFNCLKA